MYCRNSEKLHHHGSGLEQVAICTIKNPPVARRTSKISVGMIVDFCLNQKSTSIESLYESNIETPLTYMLFKASAPRTRHSYIHLIGHMLDPNNLTGPTYEAPWSSMICSHAWPDHLFRIEKKYGSYLPVI